MAEIKSTIDLIMERTKNLSASSEERKAYHRQEREKYIRGLIQRLLDDNLNLDNVKDELAKENGAAGEVLKILKKVLAGHVDPETDNERLFRIINELVGTPEHRLHETLAGFREEFTSRKAVIAERQKKVLESRDIAGPAVVPNPEADPQWRALREEAQAACVKRISQIINS